MELGLLSTCNLHHLKPDSNDFTSNALGPFFYRLCISTLLMYFLQKCTESATYSKVQDLVVSYFGQGLTYFCSYQYHSARGFQYRNEVIYAFFRVDRFGGQD